MQIGKKDIAWNIVATFMRIASGIILLPMVLRMLPAQEVGLWNIFLYIGSLATLLDFGFSNSFSRNITYIFSGVKTLKSIGFVAVDESDKSVDFSLLKSVIKAMRRYYAILAGFFLIIFLAISPFYLKSILSNYQGNKESVEIAWVLYGTLVAYQLYTYYYNSILVGRGQIKRSLQITVLSQGLRITISMIFLLSGFGLMSLVIGMFFSDFINRTLCYYSFYDKEIKSNLKNSITLPIKNIMQIMTPNAIKIGVTTIGGFLITKAVVLISPLYLSLAEIGTYGTTKQMIDLISSLGGILFYTYYPQITSYKVNKEINKVKNLYIKSKLSLIAIYIFCSLGLIFIGPQLLILIHSKTHLLPTSMMLVFLVISFLEANHGISAGLLLMNNEVPFMKASLLSGISVLLLLLTGLMYLKIGIWAMILAPGIAQIVYQNWKWPSMVIKDLQITRLDIKSSTKELIKQIKLPAFLNRT